MKTLLFALLTIFSLHTFSQEYIPDEIIVDGITYEYRYHHMEYYFKYHTARRPVVPQDSTVVGRNYVATFRIDKDRMMLHDLRIKSHAAANDYTLSVLPKIINNENEKFLNWINGLFYVGIGEKLEQSVNEWDIEYTDYLVFEVKKGIVVRKDYFNNYQMKAFKDYQYERFHRTADYQKLFQRLKKQTHMSDWQIESHILKNIIYYSKKNMLK